MAADGGACPSTPVPWVKGDPGWIEETWSGDCRFYRVRCPGLVTAPLTFAPCVDEAGAELAGCQYVPRPVRSGLVAPYAHAGTLHVSFRVDAASEPPTLVVFDESGRVMSAFRDGRAGVADRSCVPQMASFGVGWSFVSFASLSGVHGGWFKNERLSFPPDAVVGGHASDPEHATSELFLADFMSGYPGILRRRTGQEIIPDMSPLVSPSDPPVFYENALGTGGLWQLVVERHPEAGTYGAALWHWRDGETAFTRVLPGGQGQEIVDFTETQGQLAWLEGKHYVADPGPQRLRVAPILGPGLLGAPREVRTVEDAVSLETMPADQDIVYLRISGGGEHLYRLSDGRRWDLSRMGLYDGLTIADGDFWANGRLGLTRVDLAALGPGD